MLEAANATAEAGEDVVVIGRTYDAARVLADRCWKMARAERRNSLRLLYASGGSIKFMSTSANLRGMNVVVFQDHDALR